MPHSHLEWWESACFALCYSQHGGSGLGRSYIDILQMPIGQMIRDVDRLKEHREAEAEALSKASKRRR